MYKVNFQALPSGNYRLLSMFSSLIVQTLTYGQQLFLTWVFDGTVPIVKSLRCRAVSLRLPDAHCTTSMSHICLEDDIARTRIIQLVRFLIRLNLHMREAF